MFISFKLLQLKIVNEGHAVPDDKAGTQPGSLFGRGQSLTSSDFKL